MTHRHPSQGVATGFTSLLFLGIVAVNLSGQSLPLSGDRALSHVKRLITFGPRPPASPGIKKAQQYITEALRQLPLEVDHQNFLASTPNGNLPMKNIIGRSRREMDRVVILATHYDTHLMPNGIFLGANDGGSSVGLLLELARVLSPRQMSFSLWFVFFDGEEAQRAWSLTDSLYGSRYFVERLRASGQTGKIKAMILMDMVGDKDLVLEQDLNSTAWLMRLVRDSANELGYGRYLSANPKAIIDDHMPFIEAGIPAVDLIDYEFGPNNRYWHTSEDTLDKISPRSMQRVGQIVLTTLEKLSGR
jgi:Zn-dependent M28 family amino/carboxypeptidase